MTIQDDFAELKLKQGEVNAIIQELDALSNRAILENEPDYYENIQLHIAERKWGTNNKEGAIEHYEKALESAIARGNKQKEGVISMGKGFGLMELANTSSKLKHLQEAKQCLERTKEIAMLSNELSQVNFVEQMLSTVETSLSNCKSENIETKDSPHSLAHKAFLSSLVQKSTILVIIKGAKDAPICAHSRKALVLLYKCQLKFDTFDITRNHSLMETLKKETNCNTIPQVFVNGIFFGGIEELIQLYDEQTLQQSIVDLIPHHSNDIQTKEENEAIELAIQSLEQLSFDEHDKRIRTCISELAKRLMEENNIELNQEKDPLQHLLYSQNGMEQIEAIYHSFMLRLQKELGDEMTLTVPAKSVDSKGFPGITVESVAKFVEEVCPAKGECTTCPAKDSCNVHMDGCGDIEDMAFPLDSNDT